MRKLFIFLTFIAIVLISGYYYYLPEVRWHKAAESAGGYPYQIGLTNTMLTKCEVSCNGGCCTSMSNPLVAGLCAVKAPGICVTYSAISGNMSGGLGTMALFSLTQTSMAGYKPGDSIIAGGMTMTEMDNGVLAAPGGCAGCGLGKADSNIINRIASVTTYIIAGIKDKIK